MVGIKLQSSLSFSSRGSAPAADLSPLPTFTNIYRGTGQLLGHVGCILGHVGRKSRSCWANSKSRNATIMQKCVDQKHLIFCCLLYFSHMRPPRGTILESSLRQRDLEFAQRDLEGAPAAEVGEGQRQCWSHSAAPRQR